MRSITKEKMEGFIQIAIYFVIPMIIFIGIHISLYRSKEKRGTIKRKIQFGFTYLALFLYIIGLLTPISFQIMLVLAYLLMIIVWVWRKCDIKARLTLLETYGKQEDSLS